jgi:hypothetical protein
LTSNPSLNLKLIPSYSSLDLDLLLQYSSTNININKTMSQTQDRGIQSIDQLIGSSNIVTWLQDFESLTQLRGLWAHFDQDLSNQYADPPQPNDERFRIVAAGETPASNSTSGTRRTRATANDTTPTPSIVDAEPTYDKVAYTQAYKNYAEYQTNIPIALGLIKLSVDSTIRQEASRHNTPLAFFNWCKEQFTPRQEIYLQDLFKQFWETSLAELPNMQAYINQLKSIRERIIGASDTLDDKQIKAKIMGSLTDQYAHFKTAYRLMPRAEKETINQISQLLISEEHTRSSARLEEKNVVHYISSNRQSELGSPQTSSPSNWDRCNTCMCFHKGECHVKTGKIPDN